MKFKYCILFVFVTAFCLLDAYEESLPNIVEMLVLPDKMQQNWKCITHSKDQKQELIEYIPVEQDVLDLSDLVTIMLVDVTEWRKIGLSTAEDFFEHLKETQAKNNPFDRTEWTLVEKNENELMYEYLWLGPPYLDLPLEHEVVIIVLRDNTFYRLAYTHKHERMSASDKEKWTSVIASLKERIFNR